MESTLRAGGNLDLAVMNEKRRSERSAVSRATRRESYCVTSIDC